MGSKNNRKCIICGRSYGFCPSCGADAGKPSWYFIFDGENCHDIYETCVAYRDKDIDLATAYDRISKLDTSNLKDFAADTKAQIEEILKYKKPATYSNQNGQKNVGNYNKSKK